MPCSELVYDPLVASYRADPYPMYARFRTEAPIVYSSSGLQVVSRHADVSKVLRSPDVSRDIDESATDLTNAERSERELAPPIHVLAALERSERGYRWPSSGHTTGATPCRWRQCR